MATSTASKSSAFNYFLPSTPAPVAAPKATPAPAPTPVKATTPIVSVPAAISTVNANTKTSGVTTPSVAPVATSAPKSTTTTTVKTTSSGGGTSSAYNTPTTTSAPSSSGGTSSAYNLPAAFSAPTTTAPYSAPGSSSGYNPGPTITSTTPSPTPTPTPVSTQFTMPTLSNPTVTSTGKPVSAPTGTSSPTAGNVQNKTSVLPTATTTPVIAPAGGTLYSVTGGDTLSKIAAQFGMTTDQLFAANKYDAVSNPNGIKDPNLIYAGQKITVPGINKEKTPQEVAQEQINAEQQATLDALAKAKADQEAQDKLFKDLNQQDQALKDNFQIQMPNQLAMYNNLVNTPEIQSMKDKVIEYDKQLSQLSAQEMAIEGDIRKQVEGEAPESLIRAMVAEKARMLYPQKANILAEKQALETKLQNEYTNAKEQFTLAVQDQQNGLTYLNSLIDSGVQLTADQYATADKALGYGTGFTKALATAKAKALKIKNDTDAIDVMLKIASLSKTLPVGKKFTIGNDIYTAEGNKDNIVTISEDNQATGTKVFIDYNKLTHQFTVTDTGVKSIKTPTGGSSSGSEYFTMPKQDGTIGYFYGSKKNPSTAMELTPDNYLKATSKSEGVLGSGETEQDIIKSGQNWIDNQLATGKDVKVILDNLYADSKIMGSLTPSALDAVVQHLKEAGKKRDSESGTHYIGDYVGEDI